MEATIFAKAPLFDIVTLEDYAGKFNLPSPAERRDTTEIFFVTGGSLVRNFNLGSIRLNRNDLHLSLPGDATFVEATMGDVAGYYCRFNDAFLEDVYLKKHIEDDLAFINSFMYHYPLRVSGRVSGRLKNIFSVLCEMNVDREQHSSLIHAYLVTAIREIKHLMDSLHLNPFPSRAFQVTRQYYDLLMKHVAENRDVEYYAGLLGITPNHLNKSVKAVTGKTAIALRTEATVLEAKLQLRETHLPVSGIAFELGFSDLSYFSHLFKKETGYTPLGYRKKMIGSECV
ncbi:MAG: AraC family transcriptional regulator [Dysgonamonadaceae bacterium]|jgi:AraC-like DNA-binding protein|nr:AraC family transcriptional regulator [Dysgonamonadaceae bacterium]